MKIVNSLTLIFIVLVVLTNLYLQHSYNEMNWCSSEVEILRLSIDRLVQVHGIDLSE